MGYRYLARVTFPVSAQLIPAVAAWLRARPDCSKMEIDVDCVVVTKDEASSGEIDVTAVLDDHAVPYDHYHSDDCSGMPEPFTQYVRFTEGGERIEREVMEDTQQDSLIARQLLNLLDAGNLDALRAQLQEMKDAGPASYIEELASDWQPISERAVRELCEENDLDLRRNVHANVGWWIEPLGFNDGAPTTHATPIAAWLAFCDAEHRDAETGTQRAMA